MKIDPKKIAEELVSVQPMPNDCLKGLYEHSLSEKELKEQGYKPASKIGLMWVKEN